MRSRSHSVEFICLPHPQAAAGEAVLMEFESSAGGAAMLTGSKPLLQATVEPSKATRRDTFWLLPKELV